MSSPTDHRPSDGLSHGTVTADLKHCLGGGPDAISGVIPGDGEFRETPPCSLNGAYWVPARRGSPNAYHVV
jgi:hypothetical protein